jgi:hypothetical protein
MMHTSADTVSCPSCGTQQPSTRAWCKECFAAFVEPEPPATATVADALADAAEHPEGAPPPASQAAVPASQAALPASPAVPSASPAVQLAVSDLWAAQAPSRMPQILSLSVAICAVAMVVVIMAMRPG